MGRPRAAWGRGRQWRAGRGAEPGTRRPGGREGGGAGKRPGGGDGRLGGWVGAAPSLRFPLSPPAAAHGPWAPCSSAGRRGDKRRPHRQVTSFIYHLRSGVTGGQGEPPSPPLARSGGPPSSCRPPPPEAYALKAQRSRWARYPLLASGLFLLSSLPGKPSHRLCFLLQRRACPRCKKQLPFLSSKAAQNFFFFLRGGGLLEVFFFWQQVLILEISRGLSDRLKMQFLSQHCFFNDMRKLVGPAFSTGCFVL